MGDNVYFYDTEVQWAGGRRLGQVHANGLPAVTFSTPPEFKGEAGFWTPEHLFVASAEACLMATFLGIAENSHLPVVSYRSSARGKLESVAGLGLRFTEIAIFPEVEIEAAHRQKAEQVMRKAETSCLIASSMNVGLRVEPKFVVQEDVAA